MAVQLHGGATFQGSINFCLREGPPMTALTSVDHFLYTPFSYTGPEPMHTNGALPRDRKPPWTGRSYVTQGESWEIVAKTFHQTIFLWDLVKLSSVCSELRHHEMLQCFSCREGAPPCGMVRWLFVKPKHSSCPLWQNALFPEVASNNGRVSFPQCSLLHSSSDLALWLDGVQYMVTVAVAIVVVAVPVARLG